MKTKNLILAIAMILCGLSVTSCKDDDSTGSAKAVMGSSRAIEFPNADADPTMIRIASDGDWRVEAPDWLTVTPSSGTAGTTDITISANDNVRDGKPDKPRRCVLEFRGDRQLSIFSVTVRQAGDKFRDIQPSTIAEADNIEEEQGVMFSKLPVLAATKNGFIGTDGKDYVYVTGQAAQANPGQLVDMLGTKAVSDQNLTVIQCEQITDAVSGTATPGAVRDITADLDEFKSTKRELIKVKGYYDGSKVSVDGKTMSVLAEDCSNAINLEDYNGHFVNITGVYSGTATPNVRMIVTGVEDLGAKEIIYFTDNFSTILDGFQSWFEEQKATKKQTVDPVGDNDNGAYLPNLGTPKYNGISYKDALEKAGYKFEGQFNAQYGEKSGFYIRSGATNSQGMLTLPKVDKFGDKAPDGILFSFDYCPHKTGSAWDEVSVIVIVKNGSDVKVYPDAGGYDLQQGLLDPGNPSEAFKWCNAVIELKGATLTKDTEIFFRQIDSQYYGADGSAGKATGMHRFFMKNFKIYKENKQ